MSVNFLQGEPVLEESTRPPDKACDAEEQILVMDDEDELDEEVRNIFASTAEPSPFVGVPGRLRNPRPMEPVEATLNAGKYIPVPVHQIPGVPVADMCNAVGSSTGDSYGRIVVMPSQKPVHTTSEENALHCTTVNGQSGTLASSRKSRWP